MDNMLLNNANNKGRPSLDEKEDIRRRFVSIIEEVKVAHPERVRKIYIQKFNKLLSRATVIKYLDLLLKEGKVRQNIITEGIGGRTISVFRVNY